MKVEKTKQQIVDDIFNYIADGFAPAFNLKMNYALRELIAASMEFARPKVEEYIESLADNSFEDLKGKVDSVIEAAEEILEEIEEVESDFPSIDSSLSEVCSALDQMNFPDVKELRYKIRELKKSVGTRSL
jgi:predicted nuclease with TOPRIM domain